MCVLSFKNLLPVHLIKVKNLVTIFMFKAENKANIFDICIKIFPLTYKPMYAPRKIFNVYPMDEES